MCRIIEQVATRKGIVTDDANYIFTIVTEHLITKVPALKQVIEDVFEEAGDDKLKEHISKMIILLQRQGMEKFKSWQMPDQMIIRSQGCEQIL